MHFLAQYQAETKDASPVQEVPGYEKFPQRAAAIVCSAFTKEFTAEKVVGSVVDDDPLINQSYLVLANQRKVL